MDAEHNADTVAVKCCVSCSGWLLDQDRFCRWCGVRQNDQLASSELFSAQPTDRMDQVTGARDPGLCKRVSGPLISAVIDGMAPSNSVRQGSLIRHAVMALVSVPIWLMIVLLSPLDAYAAARSLVRQI
jgi:hypothetical protein